MPAPSPLCAVSQSDELNSRLDGVTVTSPLPVGSSGVTVTGPVGDDRNTTV